jgi:hypothetical protein
MSDDVYPIGFSSKSTRKILGDEFNHSHRQLFSRPMVGQGDAS